MQVPWDGYTFDEKQVNDWMANVRELVELIKAGGGGGGGMNAAQLLALIEDTSTVTAALNSLGDKIQLTAASIGGGLPVPIEIALESMLPDITGGSLTVQYFVIAEMDVTAPGKQGRAWCDISATTWSKIIDNNDTQLQTDYNQTDTTKPDYFKNRPIDKQVAGSAFSWATNFATVGTGSKAVQVGPLVTCELYFRNTVALTANTWYNVCYNPLVSNPQIAMAPVFGYTGSGAASIIGYARFEQASSYISMMPTAALSIDNNRSMSAMLVTIK